ncbi:hypothetical protein GALLR39Z86_09230 [Glycomyces algeriensis]|uniref:Uncharacterized protein n=1 Tax=Glycomyces algeriensis TaxID=256037 RepID=A0A9W6G6A0_9ACTN|nr:hypothetical protein GALLR39Z86_09230 [Glycomyces algeriensis]
MQNLHQSPGGSRATNFQTTGRPNNEERTLVSWTTIRHSGVPENTHSAVWRIGEKPHDPLDPGPYGTPGWQPDPRRGRRRRGELPDPPPAERGGEPRPVERRGEPEPIKRRGEGPGRSRFESPGHSPASHSHPVAEPHDFSPMREAAYRDFLRDSEELHRAHLEAPEPNRVLVYLRWYLQIVVAVLYWRVVPFPEPPSRCRRSRAACRPREAHQATRYVGRAAVPTRPAVEPIREATLVAAPTEPLPIAAQPDEPQQITTQPIESPQINAQPAAPPIAIEWRTAARPQVQPVTPARRADPPRPPVRPRAVMVPRNGAQSRRRADTRRIFLHTYATARDQNLRNLTWPKGSWANFTATDAYANPRRGSIQRRRNHRPRNLALARSFPSTIPAVPIGATSRPAPIGPTSRLVAATATPYPGGDFR